MQKRRGRASSGGTPPSLLCLRRAISYGRVYLTAFFSSNPAENFGTLAAAILMVSPVRGLRPKRAFRFATVNVPKFTSVTRCPFFSEVVTAPVKAWSAVPAATLVIPADAAIFAISSSLVILSLPFLVKGLKPMLVPTRPVGTTCCDSAQLDHASLEYADHESFFARYCDSDPTIPLPESGCLWFP